MGTPSEKSPPTIVNRLQAVLVTAVLYLLAAWAGLFFALPPGFASVVWPGAGVALALVLLYGPCALVGLWIGSLLANFYVVGQGGELTLSALALPAWIATGSTLQALAAAYLIKRFCRWPKPFETIRSTLQFFILGGPVSALIASSVGVLGLVLFVGLPTERAGFNWFSWWIGDTMGIWFFAPVLLVFVREKRHLRGWLILVPSMLIFSLICFAFVYSRDNFIQNIEQHVAERTDRLVASLEQKASSGQQLLEIVRQVFSQYEPKTNEEFAKLLDAIVGARQDFVQMSWYAIKPKNSLQVQQKFNHVIDREHSAGIAELDTQKTVIEDVIMRAQYQARQLSTLITSDEEKPPVMVLVLPLYHNGDDFFIPQTQYQKEFGFYGALVAQVNFLGLREIIEQAQDKWHLNVHIYQRNLVKDQVWLHGTPEKGALFTVKRTERIFSKDWHFVISHNDILPVYGKDWLSWYSLIIGTLMGCAIQVLILMLTSFNLRLSREVKEKTKDLEKMNFALVDANQIKSRFLANMSHEIRTPLNAILGFCRIAMSKTQGDLKPYYFEKIAESSKLLNQIVSDILDIAQLEKGSLKLERNAINVKKLMKNVHQMFAASARKKGIRFDVEIAGNVGEFVRGDLVRVKQILMNLCSNAIKFTDQGYVTLKVCLSHDDSFLQFSVEDSGIGIPMAYQGEIFSKFNQQDTSNTRKFGGTGLGLSITHKLVNLMNGAIWLQSTEGLGSEFFVSIPYEPTDAPEQEEGHVGHTQLRHKTILVAEDNLVNQELIREILKSWSCYVIIANNGRDALDELRDNPQIDAVLMDIQMPIMDGYQATERIRSEHRWKYLPIIALTANVMPEDVEKSLKVGMNAHLGKPIEEDLLYDTLVFFTAKKI